jgi:hypothetical protein
LEGSVCVQIDVISPNLLGGTGSNHIKTLVRIAGVLAEFGTQQLSNTNIELYS